MAEKNATKDELIKVTLPLTNEKQDDVTVVINGHVTKIQRGVEVEVTPAVFEVLENSEKMDTLALKRRKALEQQ